MFRFRFNARVPKIHLVTRYTVSVSYFLLDVQFPSFEMVCPRSHIKFGNVSCVLQL